ncbi:MAG: hypothetical protein V4676_01335 [Bacteroidota bacterium]
MKEEFVTLYGKAIIDKERLFIRSFELPFSKTLFAQISYELAFVGLFVLQFFDVNDANPAKKILGIVIWGLLPLFRLPNIYYLLFKRSYFNYIHLKNIQSITTNHHYLGLHTLVTIHLTNGRERKINFRTLENQFQPFTELIEQHIAQPQLA